MSRKAAIRSRFTQTFNKGDFLSANIYSDVRGNNCSCGGKFSARETFKGYEIPCCNKCGENPTLFRISAKILDINNQPKRIEIRHDIEGERLRDAIDCLGVLKQVRREIKDGVFDVRRYDSKISKESFLFENFIEGYKKEYDNKLKRGEISPAGLRKKLSLIRIHIQPYFTGVDINNISAPMIKKFKSSFTEKLRTRDQALSELKTILNYAYEYELIQRMPRFEKIPKAKVKETVLSFEQAAEVVQSMEDQFYKDAFSILLIYPIRPGELRALQWGDIDFKQKTITIQRHISDREVLPGRKSQPLESPKGRMTFPLTPEALEIFTRWRESLVDSHFIFHGRKGFDRFMSPTTLPRIWNKTRKKLGLGYTEAYEMRHAVGTKIYKETKDIYAASQLLGHTNINTTTRYAQATSSGEDYYLQ